MWVRTSANFVNSWPKALSRFPSASRYVSSPSSVSWPRSACWARVFDSRASSTCPSDSTFKSCNLSPGSLSPLETIRRSATDVANRIGSDGSARRVNKRGTVVGVTVRLISIQPVVFSLTWQLTRKTRGKTYQHMSRKYEHPNLRLQSHDPNHLEFVNPNSNFYATPSFVLHLRPLWSKPPRWSLLHPFLEHHPWRGHPEHDELPRRSLLTWWSDRPLRLKSQERYGKKGARRDD